MISKIDEYAGLVRDEIPAERAKFGGTVGNWENNLESMKNFALKRGAVVVSQLKAAFSLSVEQIALLEDAVDYGG